MSCASEASPLLEEEEERGSHQGGESSSLREGQRAHIEEECPGRTEQDGSSRHRTSDRRRVDEERVTGVVASLSELRAGDAFVALPFVDGDAHSHVREAFARGASLCLVSESWPGLGALPAEMRARCMTSPDVVTSFRRLAGEMRRTLSCPVAAVIGACGKTTTKEMLAALLGGPSRRVVKTPGTDNGFLGLPRTLCNAASLRGEALGAVVLEIGIDAPGAMERHARMAAPDLAIVTSLGAEHLRGFGDVATAVSEELRLLEVAPSATRVLPWGDPEVRSRASLLRPSDIVVVEEAALQTGMYDGPPSSRVLVYSIRGRGEGSVVTVTWRPHGLGSSSVDAADFEGASPVEAAEFDVPLPGAHNARNFALAVAGALGLGRTLVDVAVGWSQFEAPLWRSQVTPLARGALLFDDSFNASPPAVEAALAALSDPAWADRPKVAFLGDMLDLGPASSSFHASLTASLRRVDGLRLFTFGPEMGALARSLREDGKGPFVEGTLEDDGRDPGDLAVSFDLPERAVILVKGSRGMRMERLVRYLQIRFAERPVELSRGLVTLVSTGAERPPAWMPIVRNALRERGIRVAISTPTGAYLEDTEIALSPHESRASALFQRASASGMDVAWISIRHQDIASSPEQLAIPSASILVFGEPPLADLPEGGDVERHLAEKAQLLLRARGLWTAILPAGDPAADLLAEVAPPSVPLSRFSTAESCAEAVVRAVVLALGTNR